MNILNLQIVSTQSFLLIGNCLLPLEIPRKSYSAPFQIVQSDIRCSTTLNFNNTEYTRSLERGNKTDLVPVVSSSMIVSRDTNRFCTQIQYIILYIYIYIRSLFLKFNILPKWLLHIYFLNIVYASDFVASFLLIPRVMSLFFHSYTLYRV